MSNVFDACVVGSGIAGLSAASLLAKEGLKVLVLEQNWIPGGCTSSYPRKGFVFETGATTLVGLERNMPPGYLFNKLNIEIDAVKLSLPMQVHLSNGKTISRYESLDKWINEAELKFGAKNQAKFWKFCFDVANFVWDTSLKQKSFPPDSFSDLFDCAKNANLKQLQYARYALKSMKTLLAEYGLLENRTFVNFCNEQLLITSQNSIEETNVLFGATALCYTNFPNYYVNGGLINLVNPIVDYIEQNNGEISLRTGVTQIEKKADNYVLHTKDNSIKCKFLVSSIPINNTLQLIDFPTRSQFNSSNILQSDKLNSAFQMGIAFKDDNQLDAIHHQIHLEKPLVEICSKSIFLSLSHPNDNSRYKEAGYKVASISTHVHDPENNIIENKEAVESEIINQLEKIGFLDKQNIAYMHSSTPKAWHKWTQRAFGFVGGYPQYMKTKPWQMLSARLDGDKAYICGDTTYPGQGIPGAVLSGIIAYEKLKKDHL
ncbi:MAG: amine oxidase [Thalassobius sp.]|nr:amine oxidase [Thalassovita sp.]